MRLFIGLAVQPFAAGGLGFLSSPLVHLSNHALGRGVPSDPIDAAIAFAAGIAFVALVITVGGALPAVTWYVKHGPLTLKRVLLSGAALGNVPFAILVPLAGGGSSSTWWGPAAAVWALAVGTFFGLAGASLFWAIGVRGTDLAAAAQPADKPPQPPSGGKIATI